MLPFLSNAIVPFDFPNFVLQTGEGPSDFSNSFRLRVVFQMCVAQTETLSIV